MPELIEMSGLDASDEDLGQPSFLPDWITGLPAWVPYVVIGVAAVAVMKFIGGGRQEIVIVRDREEIGLGIIRRCLKKDLTSKKPRRRQRWCLWDSKGRRILGRHPSRSKALRQERLIQLRKRGLLG